MLNATGAAAQTGQMQPLTDPTLVLPRQSEQGPANRAGIPGRALGLESICDACRPEAYTTECVGRIEGPNFDSDGNLWMVSPGTGSIYRVAPDRHCQVVASTQGPNGMRFGPDGRLYGVDKMLGIFRIDRSTFEITFLTNRAEGANFHGLNDLYFDSAGGAYVTDAYGSSVLDPRGQVFYYTPRDGKVKRLISGNLSFPNGVVLSPDQKTLYISEWGAKRIIAVPVSAPGELAVGNAWVFAYLQGGYGPDGITVDDQGNIYAAHYGAGEVAVFDPGGSYYGAIRLPSGAGTKLSNVVFHGGYLYMTEMDQHTVWRVLAKHNGVTVWSDLQSRSEWK